MHRPIQKKSSIAMRRKEGVDYDKHSDDRLETIAYHITNIVNKHSTPEVPFESFEITDIPSKLKLLNKKLVNTIPAIYSYDTSSLVIIKMTLDNQIVDYTFVLL